MFSNEAPPDFEASSMPRRVANGIELSTGPHGVEPGHSAGIDKHAMGGCVNRLFGRWRGECAVFVKWS